MRLGRTTKHENLEQRSNGLALCYKDSKPHCFYTYAAVIYFRPLDGLFQTQLTFATGLDCLSFTSHLFE